MEAAAIPEIKEAVRRVTTVDCEGAAEAALKLDTAEAVEELIAGTFAPSLFDLLTGNDEDAPYEQELSVAESGKTLPDA